VSGYVRLPAPPYELCPKCGAANHGRAELVWRVALSGGGGQMECDCCAHVWDRHAGPARATDVC
jgi:rubredoxin